jgi:hypothetical protein
VNRQGGPGVIRDADASWSTNRHHDALRGQGCVKRSRSLVLRIARRTPPVPGESSHGLTTRLLDGHAHACDSAMVKFCAKHWTHAVHARAGEIKSGSDAGMRAVKIRTEERHRSRTASAQGGCSFVQWFEARHAQSPWCPAEEMRFACRMKARLAACIDCRASGTARSCIVSAGEVQWMHSYEASRRCFCPIVLSLPERRRASAEHR